MKSVVASSLPQRFIPRFAPSFSASASASSLSFSSARLIGVKTNNDYGGNDLPLLSQSPLSPFKSQICMASTNQNASTAADVNLFQLIQAHQEKAARLPPIEEIRTLLNYNLRGVLSTFSLKYEGYPSGSMVDFACDAYGSPILAVSSLAVHTKDLLANPRCSLLVSKDPEDRTDLANPVAFWVDFGDFRFLRIEPKVVRYVWGVATALLGSGEFSKEEFSTAKVDPIYQFSKPITSHMNKDHEEDTKLIVKHSTSVPVESEYMLDIDSLGFNVKAGFLGNTFELRIPFTRRAEHRKNQDVKTLIVEMLQAARSEDS